MGFSLVVKQPERLLALVQPYYYKVRNGCADYEVVSGCGVNCEVNDYVKI